jgi:hypothetical protein
MDLVLLQPNWRRTKDLNREIDMLLTILNRIENTLKHKVQAAGTEAPLTGASGTDVAVEVDAQNLDSAVSTGSGSDLIDLLNVIRANAEFLEVMYGDSLPIKNIMAAIERANETAQSINEPGAQGVEH